MADKTKQAFIVSSFTDANYDNTGDARHFEAGKIESLTEGAFLNFEHAGLVRAPTNDDRAANKPAA